MSATTWSGTEAERLAVVTDATIKGAERLAESKTFPVDHSMSFLREVAREVVEAITPPMPELPSVTADGITVKYSYRDHPVFPWCTGDGRTGDGRRWVSLGRLIRALPVTPDDETLRALIALKYPEPTYTPVGWQVVTGDGFTHYFDGGFAAESFAEHAGGTKRAVYVVEGA